MEKIKNLSFPTVNNRVLLKPKMMRIDKIGGAITDVATKDIHTYLQHRASTKIDNKVPASVTMNLLDLTAPLRKELDIDEIEDLQNLWNSFDLSRDVTKNDIYARLPHLGPLPTVQAEMRKFGKIKNKKFPEGKEKFEIPRGLTLKQFLKIPENQLSREEREIRNNILRKLKEDIFKKNVNKIESYKDLKNWYDDLRKNQKEDKSYYKNEDDIRMNKLMDEIERLGKNIQEDKAYNYTYNNTYNYDNSHDDSEVSSNFGPAYKDDDERKHPKPPTDDEEQKKEIRRGRDRQRREIQKQLKEKMEEQLREVVAQKQRRNEKEKARRNKNKNKEKYLLVDKITDDVMKEIAEEEGMRRRKRTYENMEDIPEEDISEEKHNNNDSNRWKEASHKSRYNYRAGPYKHYRSDEDEKDIINQLKKNKELTNSNSGERMADLIEQERIAADEKRKRNANKITSDLLSNMKMKLQD